MGMHPLGVAQLLASFSEAAHKGLEVNRTSQLGRTQHGRL